MVHHHMEITEIERWQIIFSLVHSSLVVHCSYRQKFLIVKVTRRTASYPFSGFSVGCCIERRLSVTNLSLENNFADVSTECSSRLQGKSERSVK